METAKKMGRPKSLNPRNIRLEIRLNENENKMLDECVTKLGITKTDVLIKGLKRDLFPNKKIGYCLPAKTVNILHTKANFDKSIIS